ncbi:hypothetical protein D3C76_945180 [compost metagenome]
MLHPFGAKLGDQHRQQHQQGAVDAEGQQVLLAQGEQAELRDQAAKHSQRPVQQQGHGRHADKVVGQPRFEVAPQKPEQEERQHGAEEQVLAAVIAEQLDPGRPPGGPDQGGKIERPTQAQRIGGEEFSGDHGARASRAARNAPASPNSR